MIAHCSICKVELPNGSSNATCTKLSCNEQFITTQTLFDRIQEFTVFFTDKIPNDTNYKSYLEKVGLEKKYQEFITSKTKFPTRRTWFTANVIDSHHAWPDEFGKERY
jgi:hypothetical protein